ASGFHFPASGEKIPPAELRMANMLIDSLTAPFKPEQFEDDYRVKVMAMIEARAKGKKIKRASAAPARRAAGAEDILDVLQQSLRDSRHRKGSAAKKPRKAARAKAKRS
ncbi:MAG TPA: hypothetical protein VEJ20_05650, partial [Candidatus Eremiobacteraceae bacterium]|nr:hypothetical protein [Candidatus Eremiobacteraceae bacterium]